MLQRIQTIFLFLAAAGNAAMAFLPWKTATQASSAGIFADGRFTANDNAGFWGVLLAAGAVALIALGLFKNRPLQIRLSGLSLLLTLAGTALGAWLLYATPAEGQLQAAPFLSLPVLILVFLAIRYIRKDEKKVRSADRLR